MEYSTEETDFVEKDPTGRYIKYDEILGKRAFKTVYKAFDQVEGIEVAWNQFAMSHSPQQMENLYSEVNTLRSLNHDNIIKFHDSWIDDKTKTLSMITELFTSGSLRQYRNKHKKVDTKAVKNWSRQILRGLSYLHNHNPQIIHRNLKCDHIFVNGYNGKVKIGDLGFAIELKQQSVAKNVVGTPEFMAPELYKEEYNELVDIYSFGMCILELVTGDYPYIECNSVAHVYKKVTAGVKPASLAKVGDPEVKQFIEKCLVPASTRPSAEDLLHDPFLSSDSTTKGPPSDISSTPSNTGTSHQPSVELETLKENAKFWLKGQQTDDRTISLTIKIIYKATRRADTINFTFCLDSDTTLSIATEMAEELNLTNDEICIVVELLDNVIRRIALTWKPCYDTRQSKYSHISDIGLFYLDDKDGNLDIDLAVRIK